MGLVAKATEPGDSVLPIDGTAGWYGIPEPPPQYLTRRRLLDLLDGADHAPLILVSAPAGSGKTSLIAEWVTTRGDRQNTGWITFESADESFWPGLVGCLERLGVVMADRAFPDAAVTLDRSLLGSLAAAVASLNRRLTLVVDGYEVVSSAVADDVDFLVRHSRGCLRLVVVTRADPVLPLYRYRLEDALVEVRMADLAFTDTEAAQLMDLCGVCLAPSSVAVLNARTKGWAVGLRFAAGILLDREDPDLAAAEVAGDSGNIGEYLMGEVLAAQTPEIRELLLRTSIPETLQPGLAEELGGRSALRWLAFLTRVNAFVEAVPEHQGFYRYHPFFRELLLAELACEAPETLEQLQRKTAEWFAREGQMTAAVTHFAAVDAWAEAAAWVVDEMAVGELLLAAGSSALGRALRNIPTSVDTQAAAVVRATLALAEQDAERFREELERVGELGKKQALTGPIALAVALLRAVASGTGGNPGEAMVLADAAERALSLREHRARSANHPELAGLVLASKGIAKARAGELARAEHFFIAGSSASTAPESAPLVAECLGYLSLLACLSGQPSRSESLAVRALQILEGRAVPVEGQPSAAQVALAWREMDRYDLSAVAERVKLAERSDFFGSDPVVRTVRAVVKARLQAARGDAPGALAALERVIGGMVDAPPWLVSRLRVEAAHLSVANGGSEAAIPAIEDLRPPDRAGVALVVAECQLAHGNNEAVAATVADLLTKNVPIDVRVGCLLLEASQRLRSGSQAGADAALDTALRLAEPIRLRRPFREAPPDVRRLLRRAARRRPNHAWLSNIPRQPHTSPVIPAQRVPAVTPPERRTATDTPPALPLAAPVVDALTEKELEVLGHLSNLLTTEEIASTMFISVNTIRTHVRSILRKLGVTRRNAAVRRARELGLLSA